MNVKHYSVKFFVLLLLMVGFEAAYAGLAGNVVRMAGSVTATDMTGKSRVLSAGSPVNVGDTVISGAKSSVQLQMIDAAIIAMTVNSELTVETYSVAKAGEKAGIKLLLRKGRLRTITGSTPKSAYSLTTPTAVVRIMGTVYDVLGDQRNTTVILREGAISAAAACSDGSSSDARTMDVPGTSVTIAASTTCEAPPKAAPSTADVGDLDALLPSQRQSKTPTPPKPQSAASP